MATKKDKKAEKKAQPVKENVKKNKNADDKAAKKAARMAALKNRPEGQRPNSKQIDVIPMGDKGEVVTYGMPVRKVGTLVTAIAKDAEGNVVGVSVTLVNGVSPKSKKGHGTLVPKVPGVKKGKGDVEEADDEANEDDADKADDEDEDEE
jgi:hypothetical protein